jgi:hypothetical protein
VVTAEPDWNKLPTETPSIIRRLLRRALRKDPRQRLGDIRDARLDIEEAIIESVGAAKSEDSKNRKVRGPWLRHLQAKRIQSANWWAMDIVLELYRRIVQLGKGSHRN